ncbi:oxidoreductase [Labedella phragmitis]|uniref:Oxidoreductase n=1 Tax=Labedella phragmitis TaxID=2498849 RepID=A0A444PPZ0_9MICO|nr:oxidoreductase [Labedella phragmitis]RWZ46416.1 oxidoreductase [Labedella phragmitis]
MIGAVDALIGRVPMYRLVLILLATLTAVAVALSAFGVLFFTPLELLATGGIAVALSWLVNRLVAPLFRVKPHDESALITGLLLFFIMKPGIEFGDLAAVAVAAIVAAVSKYVLAVRGRHVLNPAAIGAFVATLTGLGVSYWWVGSESLFWFVLVAGLVIVWRVRKLAMAALFVLAVCAVMIPTLVSNGMAVSAALATPFLSTAAVFFAAFMLTEPLTLAPRHRQQLVIAVVTGVLFALPYHVGPVFSSPELALIVGNLLAFLVGQRRGVTLTVRDARRLGGDVHELVFDAAAPLRFRAGQYVELHVPHAKGDRKGFRRTFSIVSAPSDGREVRVAFRVPEPASSAKRALLELVAGDTVRVTLVAGDFTVPADAERKLAFVAAGIGITPFVSQIREARASGRPRDIVLVYAVSDPRDIIYADELAGVRVLVSSRVEPTDLPDGWSWIGPERVDADVVRSVVPDLAERDLFVSGPPALVDDVRRRLRSSARRVRTDAFAGY